MTTFLIMANRIADEIVRDDLASQIKNAINDAIKTWEGIRLTFNERVRILPTVADQEYYATTGATLSSLDGVVLASTSDATEAVLEIDSVTVTVNNVQYPLTPRTQGWFDRYSSPATIYTGQPDSYGWYSGYLRLFPIPDAAYDVTISSLSRIAPNPLSADADTNAWMTEGEALIRQQAKLVIYRDIVRDAEGRAAAAEGVQEAQWQLERKSYGKLMTGTQKAWTL